MKPSSAMRLPLLAGVIVAVGCAGVASNGDSPSPAQRALIGKTKQQLLACAGTPVSESTTGDSLLFVYYKEASQLEESFPGSKSSVAKVHHGCRATILLQQDRVTGLQYESEPSSYQDDDHCEEIFQPCINH